MKQRRYSVSVAIVLLARAACAQSSVAEAKKQDGAMDVQAIRVTVPAPYLCNLPSPAGGPMYASTTAPSICRTGPETHWTCLDDRRVLLRGEDGTHHCILFPPQAKTQGTIESKRSGK